MGRRVLVIDNYDSFVYNLVQYLGEMGADPIVRRNDEIRVDEAVVLDPDGIVISPGPGTPEDAGVSMAMIEHFTGIKPILGVCLGLQCIGQVFGGTVVRAPQIMHGKTSPVRHRSSGVFTGLPQPLVATRYHSLVVARDSVPEILEVTAETDDDLVMGLRHRDAPTEGVQFHPESILTVGGRELIDNFLTQVDAWNVTDD